MPAPEVYSLGWDHGRKSFTLDQLLNFNIGGRYNEEWASQAMTAREAYEQVGWYKRCVDVRARTLAALPWAIYGRGDDPVLTESEDTPPDLAWFNAAPSIFRWEVALTMVGQAFSLKERVGRRMTGLYHFGVGTIKPVYTREGIAGYERWVNGTKVAVIPPEEVLAIWAPDAWIELGPGAPDGAAALLHAQVLHDLTGYTGENLRSGLVKKVVWTAEGRPPEPDVREQTEDYLTRWVMGRGKTRVKVISGAVKPEIIGSDLSDLTDTAISESHQRALATALGVPHSLVMSDAANFATAKADQLNFLTTTLQHEAGVIADALNRQLFDGLGLHFRFEIERTEAVQSAEAEKALASVALFTGGVLTRDEVRASMGYDPLGEEETPQAEDEVDATTRTLDLDRWRRKVEKRGRDVKFVPEILAPAEADIIRERLKAGYDLDEVFRPPFLDF